MCQYFGSEFVHSILQQPPTMSGSFSNGKHSRPTGAAASHSSSSSGGARPKNSSHAGAAGVTNSNTKDGSTSKTQSGASSLKLRRGDGIYGNKDMHSKRDDHVSLEGACVEASGDSPSKPELQQADGSKFMRLSADFPVNSLQEGCRVTFDNGCLGTVKWIGRKKEKVAISPNDYSVAVMLDDNTDLDQVRRDITWGVLEGEPIAVTGKANVVFMKLKECSPVNDSVRRSRQQPPNSVINLAASKERPSTVGASKVGASNMGAGKERPTSRVEAIKVGASKVGASKERAADVPSVTTERTESAYNPINVRSKESASIYNKVSSVDNSINNKIINIGLAHKTIDSKEDMAKEHASQSGASQSGASQSGASQSGAYQSGASQSGASPSGASQSGAYQSGGYQSAVPAVTSNVKKFDEKIQQGERSRSPVVSQPSAVGYELKCGPNCNGNCQNEQYYILGYNDGKNQFLKSIKEPASDNPFYKKGYTVGQKEEAAKAKILEHKQYFDGYEDGWRRNGGYKTYPSSHEAHYLRGFSDGDRTFVMATKDWSTAQIRLYWDGYDYARKYYHTSNSEPPTKDKYYLRGYQDASEDYLRQVEQEQYTARQNYLAGYHDGRDHYETADGKLVSDNPEYVRGYKVGHTESSGALADSDFLFQAEVEQQMDGTYVTTIVPPVEYRRPGFIHPGKDAKLEEVESSVDGQIKPPTHLAQYLGFWKGVQGDQNSCYMDASMFAMFSYLTVFDGLLIEDDPSKVEDVVKKKDDKRENGVNHFVDSSMQKKIRSILHKQIVNPLRKYGLVSKDAMHDLRKLLDQVGRVKGLTEEEKDPEEFLNLFLVDVFDTEPPILLSNGQKSHLFHLLADKNEKFKFPTVQELLERNCLQEAFKFAKIPPYLIVHLPRFGRDFKMYDMVFPSPELDITDLLTWTKQKCYICSKPAAHECYECYQERNQISQASFCEECARDYHRNGQRNHHQPRHIDRTVRSTQSDRGGTPERHNQAEDERAEENYGTGIRDARCELRLAAVLCIETSHYVTYVASDTTKKARWLFFDSMADREDTTCNNIPLIREVADFRKQLVQAYDDINVAPSLIRRLVKDGYICFYSYPDAHHY